MWIAFVLCTFGLIYSTTVKKNTGKSVVNCFRSLYLWVDLQPVILVVLRSGGCELLSFFVPLGWFTAIVWSTIRRPVLWIAFVLCTFGLIYSLGVTIEASDKVVNCFRSLYLWVDLQRRRRRVQQGRSCELLSFFVPLGWFTAKARRCLSPPRLWIAFVLCTFGLIYSISVTLDII